MLAFLASLILAQRSFSAVANSLASFLTSRTSLIFDSRFFSSASTARASALARRSASCFALDSLYSFLALSWESNRSFLSFLSSSASFSSCLRRLSAASSRALRLFSRIFCHRSRSDLRNFSFAHFSYLHILCFPVRSSLCPSIVRLIALAYSLMNFSLHECLLINLLVLGSTKLICFEKLSKLLILFLLDRNVASFLAKRLASDSLASSSGVFLILSSSLSDVHLPFSLLISYSLSAKALVRISFSGSSVLAARRELVSARFALNCTFVILLMFDVISFICSTASSKALSCLVQVPCLFE